MGEGVIICLIQIGGLGLVTLASFFCPWRCGGGPAFHSMKLASESINTSDVAEARKAAVCGDETGRSVRGVGALLLAPVFVPEYGPQGICISVFLAISAFCNAGFDVLGREGAYASLTNYTASWYVQAVIMCLIIAGRLGFLVWHDLAQWRRTKHLTLHTKVVLFCTARCSLWAVP